MLKTKEIYLDVCVLSRPFDDQNLLRIRLETDAFYLIMKHIHVGHYILLYSAVHMAETDLPFPEFFRINREGESKGILVIHL